MSRPTLVSLARELGVSRQTVSNVLNAPHLVRPETRERVQAAIEASGYRPNGAAQALRSQRSMTVAMRIYPTLDGGINGAVMDDFVHHLVGALRSGGYHLLLITARSFDDEVEALRALHDAGRIDGCVLTSTHRDDPRPDRLRDAGLEVAAFGTPWGDEGAEHLWLDVDNAEGTRQATRHLLAEGHRRIGFLGWEQSEQVGEARRRGWQEAMAEAGLPAGDALARRGVDGIEAGRRGMQGLLACGVDAVVCASDSLALGALEVLRQQPGDAREMLPVIGFDDTAVAAALGLSSVRQPMEEAAELLARGLVARLSPPSRRAETITSGRLLAPRLVLR